MSRFEKELCENAEKLVSKMYKLLLLEETRDEVVKTTMIKWAQDVGHNIDMAAWGKRWEMDLKFAACYALKENYYKMMYRWYLTPQKLALMYKNVPNKCWKCGHCEGTFFHMWWSCGKAKAFWDMIYN